MHDIRGKVVLLTGASRGLGVEMGKEFAAKGSRLALAARSEDELGKTKAQIEELGAEAVAIPTDVSDTKALQHLVDETANRLGPIDVLVNNAGVEKVCDFESMSLEEIDSIVRTNVIALIQLSRLVVPSMIERRQGHIVNISSMAGLLPVPHNSVYSATKHAVVGISRSLRFELKSHGIGVSVICPGFVEGGMFLEWGRKPPAMAGIVSSSKVAKETVRAVIENRAEIKVNPPFGKIGPTVVSVSPRLFAQTYEGGGMVKFLEEQARINAAKG